MSGITTMLMFPEFGYRITIFIPLSDAVSAVRSREANRASAHGRATER